MRAMIVANPASIESLRAVERSDPGEPGVGEVRVRIHASSLNYHDYLVVNGTLTLDEPRIPLSDAGGEVIAVGDGVADLRAGDRVVSVYNTQWPSGRVMPRTARRGVPGDTFDGYARESVVTPANWFTRAPKGYSHAEAATLTCAGVTAWRALARDGPVAAGQSVLVLGTGGVSIAALQFAKASGAIVIATSSSDAKLDRLKKLGADHVINYRTTPDWGQAAFDIAGGVDHVVDVGGSDTLPQSVQAVKPGGHVAVIGVLTGRSVHIPIAIIARKVLRLQGVQVGSRQDQLDMVAAIDATSVRPVIDSSFALEGLAEAFRRQESGAHFGKIVITV